MSAFKPRSELTQEEAIESITRLELRMVKERFGVSLVQDFDNEDKLEDCLWAMVWLFEHRKDPDFTEARLDAVELGTVLHYFTEKICEGDESPAGKEPASPPKSSQNGAQSQASDRTFSTT